MLELEEALEQLLAQIPRLGDEMVVTSTANGRILGRDIVAPIDLPPFDNSAMDGYAVVAAEVREATRDHPVILKQISRVAAGDTSPEHVNTGQCIRIFTGSPMPKGANAVVMQEDTCKPNPSNPESIAILDGVKPWENVRLRGEDLKKGTKLFSTGTKIHAPALALLEALGLEKVCVYNSPVVGILATGSELVEPGHVLTQGKIFESNRSLVANLSRQCGGQPKVYPIIQDTLKATTSALAKALDECDAVVTSGGVSVGELDFVKEAFMALGGKMEFWKIAIRPGKPFVFGQRLGKYWFGLPGNPVSALVTFLLLVRPAILKMQGATELCLRRFPGRLKHHLENRGDRRHFMRVKIRENGDVESTGTQASHVLSSLVSANGLVDVPPHTQWAEGSDVKVLLWDA